MFCVLVVLWALGLGLCCSLLDVYYTGLGWCDDLGLFGLCWFDWLC